MPLLSADPFGGVIITDWYGPPESQNERFKLNVFILGKTLRSDGVRATVFKQVKIQTGPGLTPHAMEARQRRRRLYPDTSPRA